MGNVGWNYSRVIDSVINEFSFLGGFASSLFIIFTGLYMFIVEPFRNLNLALAYQKALE